MCMGIIRNNSLVGRRARAEARTPATERVMLYCTWRSSALTTQPHGQVDCCDVYWLFWWPNNTPDDVWLPETCNSLWCCNAYKITHSAVKRLFGCWRNSLRYSLPSLAVVQLDACCKCAFIITIASFCCSRYKYGQPFDIFWYYHGSFGDGWLWQTWNNCRVRCFSVVIHYPAVVTQKCMWLQVLSNLCHCLSSSCTNSQCFVCDT